MGVVVAAHHLGLDKPVAIKLMRPELRTRKEFVRRFVREARAAARLNSPHVARVFDVGVLDDGAPYIVMEYLDGIDLAGWLRQRGPVSVPLAAAILLQVCDAIAEAHAAGIIHRDLKPSNLLVVTSRDGEPLVKVLDLGICKLVSRPDEPGDTATGPAPGTPLYMAPEQLAGASRADPRSDVWSLGAILYELVTGSVPFRGRTAAELCAHVGEDPGPEIRRADVAGDFAAIVVRCLAKDPAARFQRVAELAAALAPFAADPRPGGHAAVSTRRTRRPRRWASPAVVAAALVASAAWQVAPMPGARSGAAAGSAAPSPAGAVAAIGSPRSPEAVGALPSVGPSPPVGASPSVGALPPVVASPPSVAQGSPAAPTFPPAARRSTALRGTEPRLPHVQPQATNARAPDDGSSTSPIAAPRDRGAGSAIERTSPRAPSEPSVAPMDPLATPY